MGAGVWQRCAVLFLCATLFAGCKPTLDPVASANVFFEHLRRGELKAAYDSAAFSFQAKQTEDDFMTEVKERGLPNYRSLAWKETAVTGREAKLGGEMLKEDGDTLRLDVTLVQHGREWKLHSLRASASNGDGAGTRFSLVGRGSGFRTDRDRPLPSDAEVKALVRESMSKFAESVRQRSFAGFYEYVSRTWQSQLTERRLQNAFQPFIDADVKLDAVADSEPVLEKLPELSSEGLLIVNGYYPVPPYRAMFELKYIYELPNWKLFGINIDVVK